MIKPMPLAVVALAPRSVSSASRLRLLLILAGLAVGLSTATAAPPPNDVCSGAQIIPGTGPFPYATSMDDITEATISASDPPISNPDLVGRVAQSVWYRFTPALNGVYTITTCTDAGTATTVQDTVLAVYTSPGGCSGPFTQVGPLGDEDCGPNGSQAAVTSPLAADTTYHIVVWKYCNNCTDDGLNQLQLIVSRSVAPPNDTCANAIPVQLNIPMTGTTVGAANNYELTGTNGFTGLDQTPSAAHGRDVVYSFTAPDAAEYSIKALNYDVNQDLVLYVLTNCPAGPSPVVTSNYLAAANRSRVNSAEEIPCLALAAQQVINIVVDDHNLGNLGSSFTLEVTRCQREREPNNQPETAAPLACGLEGKISPEFDQDFFALGSYPAGWRAFALVDGEAAKNQDLDLRITTATETLEYDNDNNDAPFGESSANIAGTPLPGGSTYVLVTYNGNLRETEPYRLYALVQPPLDQAVPETEPNDDFTIANQDDRNYFFGTLDGPSPSTDVDVYGFNVAEGDLIYVGLDGDPHRTNAPINARLELLDASGNPVVSVNDRDSNSVTNGPPGLFPSSPAEGLVYRSPVEGAFFVRVSISPTAAGADAAGDYLLSISRNCVIGGLGQHHAPWLTNIVLASTVSAGVPASLTGTIWELEAGETLALEIRWGDGTTNRMNYVGGGQIDFSVPHAYAVPDTNQTVTVTVQDHLGSAATFTQAVHVQVQPAHFLSIATLANGHINLQLEGAANTRYRIESAPVLGSWSTLTTLTADGTGRFSFEDTAPGPGSKFYRAVTAD